MTSGSAGQLTSFLAQWLPLLVVVAAGVVGLSLPPERRVPLLTQAVVGLGLTVLAVRTAGALHVDPRPFVVDRTVHPLFPHPADNGFPSDHTTFAVAASAVVLGVRRRTGAVLLVLGVVGGLARVLANVHHVQDIVGGVLLGLVAAGLAALVTPWLMTWGVLRRLEERWSRVGRPAMSGAARRG